MTFPAAVTHGPRTAFQAGLAGSVRSLGKRSSGTAPREHLSAASHRILTVSLSLALPQAVPQRPTANFPFPQAPTPAKQNPIKNQHWAAV
jgi:hypothetical protein